MNLTLTEIIEQLDAWETDLSSDCKAQWASPEEKLELEHHLQLLMTAKANLALLHKDKDAQTFKSSIKH